MESTCPRCRAVVPGGSVYCPMCGVALGATPSGPGGTAASVDDASGIVPVPGVTEPPDLRIRKRRRRKPWYRRKRFFIPMVTIAILLVVLGSGAWYVKTRFDTLNQMSTPAPEIGGDRLGGDEDLVIDTGPAQEAIRDAEQRRQGGPVATTAPELARSSETPSSTVTSSAESATQPSSTGSGPTATVEAAGRSSTGGGVTATVAMDATSPPSGTSVASNPVAPDATATATVAPTALARQPEPVSGESYAFLMMGVDARPGDAIDIGVRPDSLFVVYLDGSDGSCRVLSVPRDTRVELPGYGQSKINHALAVGGVPYERLVVENLLGIELEHYGLVDFAGVEGIVDGVGGITVENDEAFEIGGVQFPDGTLTLDGEEALLYSRYRGGDDGDFGRQERQQQVVRAVLTQGADLDVVTAIPGLLGDVKDHVRTDLGLDEMVDIAQDFRSTCTAGTLETQRMDGTVGPAYDDLMQQELSFVFVDPAEVDRKVAWLLTGDDAVTGDG